MPKPTFLQLPDEKRQRFTHAALVEFTDHSYDVASVSRLVSTLGIAKGSLYQYFGDKFELFEWLLQESGRRKVQAIEAGLAPDPEADVLARLRQMYWHGLAFWQAEPRWASLGLRVHEPSREPRLAALRQAVALGAHAFVRGLLAEGQSTGQLRADVPLDATAHLVTSLLSVGLRDALLAKVGLAPGTLPDHPLDVRDADLEQIVNATMGLLERGLQRPEPSG